MQQIQAKLEQSVAKEQEVLAKLRTSLAISEQNEIEKAGVLIMKSSFSLSILENVKYSFRLLLSVTNFNFNLMKLKKD